MQSEKGVRMDTLYDKMDYAEDLQAAGVPPEQSRAHAKALFKALAAMGDVFLATKDDIGRLDKKIDSVEAMLRTELAEFRKELKAELRKDFYLQLGMVVTLVTLVVKIFFFK